MKMQLPEGKKITVYLSAFTLNDYEEGPRYTWFYLDQAWLERAQSLLDIVKKHSLAHVTVEVNLCWHNNEEYRMGCEDLSIGGESGDERFWFIGYPKHANHSVGTYRISFRKLAKAITEAIQEGKDEVFIDVDEMLIEVIRGCNVKCDEEQECIS